MTRIHNSSSKIDGELNVVKSFPNGRERASKLEPVVRYDNVDVPANGWITSIAVRARSSSPSGYGQAKGRVCLWSNDRNLLFESLPISLSKTAVYHAGSVPALRITPDTVKVGMWFDPASEEGKLSSTSIGLSYLSTERSTSPPKKIDLDDQETASSGLVCYLDYTENAEPSRPVILSPANGQSLNETSINVTATLPHPSSDSAYDYTKDFQIRVFENDSTTAVYDQILSATSAERANGQFTRQITELLAEKNYTARVRHRDSWGAWSPYSTSVSFSTIAAGDPPEIITPLVKLNKIAGFSYEMVHNHPEGLSANAAQVELYNATGATKLWTSALTTLNPVAAPGEKITLPASGGTQPSGTASHPTLAWGTAYRWRARIRDSAGAYSAWSSVKSFRTNLAPATPTDLRPENNTTMGGRSFSATVKDQDGDEITGAQIELVRVSTGQTVSGYPKQMTVSGNTAVFTAEAADLVQAAQYRFRIRATDGQDSGYGAWSGYSTFIFAVAPVVAQLAPAPRTNLVKQPSAEYEPSAENPFWSVVNPDTTGTNSIVREASDDTYFGNYRWVGVSTDTTKAAPYMQSERMPVAELERYLVQMMVKQLPLEEMDPDNPQIPATASELRLYCYASETAANALGSVVPASITALSSDPENFWKRYGGAVWPSDETSSPRFPAGTTYASIRITPVSGASVGRVAFDAIAFEKMSDSAAGEQFADSSFFGYGDPDLAGYGGLSGEWSGEEGNSPSTVLPVLIDAASNHVMYSYSHPSGSTLNATRVVAQRWDRDRGAWRAAYDSGYRAPAATPTITLPDYLFTNEMRYRTQVYCRDSAGVIGSSGWTEIISRYPGPPELPVYSFTSDPEAGTVTIAFGSTTLEEGVFEAIEVARSSEDEPFRIVAAIRNPGQYEYTYHYPLSDKPYDLFVRQVASVGPETIAGRWTGISASVSYPKTNFLKNAHDPSEFIAFQHDSGSGPAVARSPQSEGHIPWGSELPVHLFSEARTKSDTTTFALYPPSGLIRQSETERLRILKKWERERPPLALIVEQPESEKFFIALTGEMKFRRVGTLVYAEMPWEGTAFSEPTPDELEGIVDLQTLLDLTAPGGGM